MNEEKTIEKNDIEEENPVSMARQILAIEADMKEKISVIQEVLAELVADKVNLDNIKAMAKNQITELANEEE